MPEITFPSIRFEVIAPHLFVLLTALVVLIADLFYPRDRKEDSANLAAALSLAGVIFVMIFQASLWKLDGPMTTLSGMMVLDRFSLFFNAVFLIAAALSILISWNYLKVERIESAEYYALLLFAVFGMMIMGSTPNLLMIFIGLEIMSMAVYVMAGLLKRQLKSNESALKYFLLGAFSTGFLLYGIVGLYAATGSLNIHEIGNARLSGNFFAMAGMALLIVGFGFKIASVPFHMWTPDVYEGAPTSVTGFMAVGVKAAAFAAFLRVFVTAFGGLQIQWACVLWFLAVLTMTYGNVVALVQTNIKRMLAYSSIAHAGYILVAMVAMIRADNMGAESVLYYLLVYTFMNLGAFGVVAYLAKKDEQRYNIEDYAGIAYRHPLAALAMTIFMLSLAGIPPLAGFVGKFYIFSAAVKAGLINLVIIGVLNSALSVYYYIRIVYLMYMKDPAEEGALVPPSFTSAAAIALSSLAVLILGIFPSQYLEIARHSIRMFLK